MKGRNFSIRKASKADLDLLPDLEGRADQAYADMPEFTEMLACEGLTIEQCRNLPNSSQTWLAYTDQPVGFVFTRDIDDLTYLGQLSVVPEAQGQGIGTALMHVAIKQAQLDNKLGVVLATNRNVVFNAPYYAKHGFEELSRKMMGEELRELAIADEEEWGRFSPRIIMGRFFSDS